MQTLRHHVEEATVDLKLAERITKMIGEVVGTKTGILDLLEGIHVLRKKMEHCNQQRNGTFCRAIF